jgi:hypothetical protein
LVLIDWCRDAVSMRLLAAGLALTQRLRRRISGVQRQRLALVEAGFVIASARRFRAPPLWGMMAVRATSHPRR